MNNLIMAFLRASGHYSFTDPLNLPEISVNDRGNGFEVVWGASCQCCNDSIFILYSELMVFMWSQIVTLSDQHKALEEQST